MDMQAHKGKIRGTNTHICTDRDIQKTHRQMLICLYPHTHLLLRRAHMCTVSLFLSLTAAVLRG